MMDFMNPCCMLMRAVAIVMREAVLAAACVKRHRLVSSCIFRFTFDESNLKLRYYFVITTGSLEKISA